MRVWGIGATWSGKDKSKDFVCEEYIAIGYKAKEAPDLYEMLKDVRTNDMVYIKSFVPTSSKNLSIKAVGIVSKIEDDKIKVDWFADFTDKPYKIPLSDIIVKNNVYNNTLYREYNEEIICRIFQYIKNTLLETDGISK